MLIACIALLAEATLSDAKSLVYSASLQKDSSVRIVERSWTEYGLREESFVVTAKVDRPYRSELALNETRDRLFLHLEFRKSGDIGLRSTTYVFATVPLKVVGKIDFDSGVISPQWVSPRAIAFQAGYEQVSHVRIDETAKGLTSTTDERAEPDDLTPAQVEEVLAILSRHKAKPAPRIHQWFEFVSGFVSATRGMVAVSADRSRIVFHGVIKPQFTDGASSVYVMNKADDWKPTAIATIQDCESVLVRGDYVIIYFRSGDETWAHLFSIREQQWRSLGRTLGADIAVAATG